tara:strand:- start:30838 stop:31530 length:693 start_codon:yes stop_codon:yes gene_type:complete
LKITSSTNISVLISVYNDEQRISHAIDSILDQTHENFELLIMDDYSTDETYAVCKDFEEKDTRIKLFKNNKNLGLTKSLNVLIEKSNHPIIARQDSDDISFPDRLNQQLNFMNSNNLDACTTIAYTNTLKRRRPFLSQYLPQKFVMKYKNPFVHGTLVIKKDILSRLGNYNEKFYYSQDYKLITDLINEKFKIKILKRPLYELNVINNISTMNKDDQKYYASCVRKGITP